MTEISLDKYYDAVVYDSNDDKVGGVGQVFLDEASGQPSWVTVRTGLFGLKENFVPLVDARLNDGKLHVAFTKDVIKDAPKLDPEAPMTVAEEDALQAYYGTEDEPEKMSANQRRDGQVTAPQGDAPETAVPAPDRDGLADPTNRPEDDERGERDHDIVDDNPDTAKPKLVTDREAARLDAEPDEGVITVVDADLSHSDAAQHHDTTPPRGRGHEGDRVADRDHDRDQSQTHDGQPRVDNGERRGTRAETEPVEHKEWSEPEKEVYGHQTGVASDADRDLLDTDPQARDTQRPDQGRPDDTPRRAE